MFRELIPQLAGDYHVIAPDHLGFGHSDAPLGWRPALRRPKRISALVTLNGNGYEDGFVESFWKDVWAYGANPGPDAVGWARSGTGSRAFTGRPFPSPAPPTR